MNDQALIEALKSGDRSAFKVFYETYADRVYNTALGLVQNEDDARDITQEVFVTAFENIRHFRQEAQLSTWLYRITVSQSLDFIKAKKRKKRGGGMIRIFKNKEDRSMPDVPHFAHPGVLLEQQENARILFAAVQSLPDNQKVAFTLHKVEGLSYQEVADTMNMSLSAVESLLHRAKQNLKKWLENYYKNESPPQDIT